LVVHPNFKKFPTYKLNTSLVDPECGPPLGAPELDSDVNKFYQ